MRRSSIRLRDLTRAPSVSANSSIPGEGDGPIEIGDDVVLKYSSVHIDEAESELVVRSGDFLQ